MKRVYDIAAVSDCGDGYGVTLDGKPLRTPAHMALVLPKLVLAEAIADEWNAQSENVEPESMPLMRLASLALDWVVAQREVVIDEVADYGSADLLCYRIEHPQELARRQKEIWHPVLDWAARRFDAPLAVTNGVLPVTQDPQVLAKLRAVVAEHDSFALAGLHAATHASGSLILALALASGHCNAAAVAVASQLDEAYQAEKWGRDAEAEARLAALKVQLHDAERFLTLLGAATPDTSR